MAVYEQSYAPWSGVPTSRGAKIWAMIRPGLSQPFRNIWTLIIVTLAYVLVAGWLLILFAVASSRVPQVFAVGNNIYREEFYNNPLFSTILVILSATVGASLISRDIKHHALLMYYSRAITRADYVLAKFLTLVLFLLFVTLGPGLLLFLGQLGLGMEKLTTAQRLADLGAITLHSLILVVPMAAAVLACSSLTKRAYIAGIMWAIFFFSSIAFSEILTSTLRHNWCRLISWTNLTSHLGNLCYQARPVKSILGHRPPPAVLDGGWEEPLIVLAGITIASLLIVFRRVRSVEVAE